MVETIVTIEDVDSTEGVDLYESALWEFGIKPGSALAVVGCAGRHTPPLAGLATEFVSVDYEHLDSAAECAASIVVGGPTASGWPPGPRSIWMTALKSLSAWSAANFA